MLWNMWNCLDGVIVSLLALSVLDQGFNPWSCSK